MLVFVGTLGVDDCVPVVVAGDVGVAWGLP